MLFAEAYVIQAFDKKPYIRHINETESNDDIITMEVTNPGGDLVYTTYSKVLNATAAFTYKFASKAIEG